MVVPDLSRVAVYVGPGATDMHKAANGLSITVAEEMAGDPLCRVLYAFYNRDRFPWPASEQEPVGQQQLFAVGEETRELVQVIPEQMWVERHVCPKYRCHTCEGSADEDRPAVRIARLPTALK